MQIEPIGIFHGDAVYKYDAPRQGRLFAGHPGRIELAPGRNFETALRDLEGFERIWVIFQFHENEGWRPTTRPPVPAPGRERVGTFASRSPYRPNPIGLSCVRLLKVDGLTLYVDESDLLDGSPVLDIKPYVPLADSFPEAKAGWVDEQSADSWALEMSKDFAEQSCWLAENSPFDLESFVRVQLVHGPFDVTRKRISLNEGDCSGVLAYRTFRISFRYGVQEKRIFLERIYSGYSKLELDDFNDIYADKAIHRAFLARFDVP